MAAFRGGVSSCATARACTQVACIQRVANPVSVARLVMERSEHVLLVGSGAEEFARECGVEEVAQASHNTDHVYPSGVWVQARALQSRIGAPGAGRRATGCRPPMVSCQPPPAHWRCSAQVSLVMPAAVREWEEHQLFASARDSLFNVSAVTSAAEGIAAAEAPRPPPRQCDTVGAVALDSSGAVAAATSTGGITNKRDGSVVMDGLAGLLRSLWSARCGGAGPESFALPQARVACCW